MYFTFCQEKKLYQKKKKTSLFFKLSSENSNLNNYIIIIMTEINILQRGNVYFFYRSKIEKNGVQRFFLVLRPEKQESYHLLIIGKKRLPVKKEKSYFAFLEAIKESKNDLLQTLGEKHYSTKTRGERTLPFCYCLGEGKYLLLAHGNHTHFIYQLVHPTQIKKSQEEFHIQKEDDYLISVKNPQIGVELRGIGLDKRQKVNYPTNLQEKFSSGYHFVPLNPADFLNYEGAELLLIPKTKESLIHTEKGIVTCLNEIYFDNLLNEFAQTISPEAIAPIEE